MNRVVKLLIIVFIFFPILFLMFFNKNMGNVYEVYRDETTTPPKAGSIVLIANNMQNKYTAVMVSALREFLKGENLRLFIYDAEGSVEKQIYYLKENLNKNEIKAIIIIPCHEEKLNKLIEKFYSKNIPVVIVNRKIYKAPFDCYVGQDDIEIGFLQADFIVEKFKNKKANILLIAGSQDSIVATQRLKGVLSVFKGFKNINVVGIVYTEGNYNSSYERVKTFLAKSNATVDGIIAQSDDILLGALQALNERKMHVVSIGADALPSTLEYIKEGKVTATIYNNSFDIASETFNVLRKLLKKEVVYSQVFIPPRIINNSNVDKYINEMSFTYLVK